MTGLIIFSLLLSFYDSMVFSSCDTFLIIVLHFLYLGRPVALNILTTGRFFRNQEFRLFLSVAGQSMRSV